MSVQRYQIGDRMSQIAVHNGTVYTAGQVALSAGGQSVAAQTQNILDQIDALLAEAGTDKSKVFSAMIWINSMDDFAEMNEVWDKWVVPGATPVRACVESPRLASPKFQVEIQVTAAL